MYGFLDSSLTNTTWHRRFNHASVVLRAMGSLFSICLIAAALVFASASFTSARVEAAPEASITSTATRQSGSNYYYIPGDTITTSLVIDDLINGHCQVGSISNVDNSLVQKSQVSLLCLLYQIGGKFLVLNSLQHLNCEY